MEKSIRDIAGRKSSPFKCNLSYFTFYFLILRPNLVLPMLQSRGIGYEACFNIDWGAVRGRRGEFFRGAIDNMSAILNPLVMSLPSRGGGQNNLITYQHKLSNSVMSIYLRARFIVLRSFCQRILSKEAFSFKFLDASLKAFLMRLASYSSNTALVTFPAVSVGSSILIFGPRQTLEYIILSKVVPVRIEMMSAH